MLTTPGEMHADVRWITRVLGVRNACHDGRMALDVDALLGLAVADAERQAEAEGVRVKVVVEGDLSSAERGINRIVLIARDDTVVQAYWG